MLDATGLPRGSAVMCILVSDKILIFSLFVGCFYHKDPASTVTYSLQQMLNYNTCNENL